MSWFSFAFWRRRRAQSRILCAVFLSALSKQVVNSSQVGHIFKSITHRARCYVFRVIIQSSLWKLSGKVQSVIFDTDGVVCCEFSLAYFVCTWVTRDDMPWHSEGFNTYSLQSVCFLSALGLLIAFAYWFAVCSVTCFKHPLPYVTVNWDWPGRMECQCLPMFVGWDWSGISFEEHHGDECTLHL